MSKITLYESAESPSTPSEGQVTIFAKDGTLRSIDSVGNENEMGSQSSEYRWSVLFPFEIYGAVVPKRQGYSQDIPISDRNSGSIVSITLNIQDNESLVTKNIGVYRNGMATPLVVEVEPGVTGIVSSLESISPISAVFEDVISIGSESSEDGYIYGVASVTFSSAPVALVPGEPIEL